MSTKRVAIAVSALVVNTAKHYLEAAGIPCFVINKKDSVYPMIGRIEIYVNESDIVNAKAILKENDILEE